jgi:hypothetical protein
VRLTTSATHIPLGPPRPITGKALLFTSFSNKQTSALMTDETRPSETSVTFYKTIPRNIPEDQFVISLRFKVLVAMTMNITGFWMWRGVVWYIFNDVSEDWELSPRSIVHLAVQRKSRQKFPVRDPWSMTPSPTQGRVGGVATAHPSIKRNQIRVGPYTRNTICATVIATRPVFPCPAGDWFSEATGPLITHSPQRPLWLHIAI